MFCLIRPSKKFQSDVSVDYFFRQILPDEVVDYLIDPFAGGVYAGNIQSLSAQACFPKFWKFYNQSFCLLLAFIRVMKSLSSKKVVSFDGGLEDLILALQQHIKEVLLESPVVGIKRGAYKKWILRTEQSETSFDGIVLSCPSFVMARLLEGELNKDLYTYFLKLPYQEMSVLQCVWQRPENFQPGYGALIPQAERKKLRGSLWPSEMFFRSQLRDKGYLRSVNFFSELMDQNTLLKNSKFLFDSLGLEGPPVALASKKIAKAIPQYSVGHCEKLKELQKALPEGVYLAGNYLEGVGLSSVMATCEALCETISRDCSSEPLQSEI